MSKEAVDPRLLRFRDELGDSRKKIASVWVEFSPLRDKTLPKEERVSLKEKLKPLGRQWREQIEKHIRVAKDIEAVKWELGLPIRQEEQEIQAAATIQKDVQKNGGTSRAAQELSTRLICLTNRIQERERAKRPAS